MKGREKDYTMITFSQASNETITIKNLKRTSNMAYVNEKTFKKNDILYTVEKLLKVVI